MAGYVPISLAVSACALLIGPAALAVPSVTLSPTTGHPKITVEVSASGFGASEAVDVYFDTTDVLLGVTNGSGALGTYALKIPADAAPGTHWITVIGRKSGDAGQKAFVERTDWLQEGFTAAGEHRNPYENVLSPSTVSGLTLAWSVPANEAESTPAVFGGLVYVGGQLGNLYAFDAATGALKWKRTQCTSAIASAPAVGDGMVYLGCYSDNKLYAYSATNGALKWSQVTGGAIDYASPTVAKGIVYVSSTDGHVSAFNATSGAPLWSLVIGIAPTTPIVANGILYVGDANNSVFAFNAATGSTLWYYMTGGEIHNLTVANNTVYAGSGDGNLYAFNATTGDVNWEYNAGNAVTVAPAFWNGAIYTSTSGGFFFAVRAGSGSLLWSTSVGEVGDNAINAANGLVYVSTTDGRVHAIDAANGEVLWDATAGNGYNTSPVVADGVLYVGSADTGDHNLHAFALGGGDAAVYHRNPTPPPFASLHPDRRLKPALATH